MSASSGWWRLVWEPGDPGSALCTPPAHSPGDLGPALPTPGCGSLALTNKEKLEILPASTGAIREEGWPDWDGACGHELELKTLPQ